MENPLRCFVFLARHEDFDLTGKVSAVISIARVLGRHNARTSKRLAGTVQDRMETILLEACFDVLAGDIIKRSEHPNHAFEYLAGCMRIAKKYSIDETAADGTEGIRTDDTNTGGVRSRMITARDVVDSKRAAVGTEIVFLVHQFTASHAWRRAGFFPSMM